MSQTEQDTGFGNETEEIFEERVRRFDFATAGDEARLALNRFRAAKRNAEAAKRSLAQAREVLDRVVGDATEIFFGERQLYGYSNDGAFNQAKFIKEMPHIAEKYSPWKAVRQFDEEAFRAENEGLYTEYRTRTLRELKEDK